MYCGKCGALIQEGALFCGKCGTPRMKTGDENVKNGDVSDGGLNVNNSSDDMVYSCYGISPKLSRKLLHSGVIQIIVGVILFVLLQRAVYMSLHRSHYEYDIRWIVNIVEKLSDYEYHDYSDDDVRVGTKGKVYVVLALVIISGVIDIVLVRLGRRSYFLVYESHIEKGGFGTHYYLEYSQIRDVQISSPQEEAVLSFVTMGKTYRAGLHHDAMAAYQYIKQKISKN